MPNTDIAVIGAGAAGLSVAGFAAALGLKVVLFERDRMGGECLNTGCVPSKALLACAKAAHAARDGARFGVHASDVMVDWKGVRAHLRGAITAIAANDAEARFRGMGVDVVRASAYFASPNSIAAAGRTWRFRRCVVAAGSAPVVPVLPGLASVPYSTNESIFDLEVPPGHLLILGGGAIGLEMAQAHARLGCRVTVVESGAIAGREDPEFADVLRGVLGRDGVTLLEHTEAVRVEGCEDALELLLSDGTRITGTHLLLALGRTPRLAPLDLATANVRTTRDGVATDRGLRSVSNRRIWAAGDIADPEGLGPRRFTHVCSQHAALLARSVVFRLPAKLDYAALPRVTYTDPELAQVGMTAAEAEAAGYAVRTQRWPLSENDRAVAEGIDEGAVKLVANSRGRLLGAGVLAPHAGEMAGMFGLMISRNMNLSALAGLVLPYPTLAEAAKRAAANQYASVVTGPVARRFAAFVKHFP